MASFLVCALSKKPAETPVVSRRSGLVFEKSTIEKYIDINGSCPLTGDKLDHADLVAIRSTPASPAPGTHLPPPLEQHSIPETIHRFRDQWDSVALETHSLKQHIFKLRKELSHLLYQQDASHRVIARLVRERDEARK